MKVLIADDCQATTSMLEYHLHGWGYETMTVSDGEQALRVLRSAAGPKLAILDWSMPGLDGIEVCRELRRQGYDSDSYTYLVMLTSKDGQEAVAALEAGVDDYLSKSVPPRELQLRLRAGKRIVELQQRVMAANRKLSTITTYDPDTLMLTRNAFLKRLSEEVDRAERQQSELALIHAAIDQDIQGQFGKEDLEHLAGQLAQRLKKLTRSYDLLTWVKGQAFLIALPDASAQFAIYAAERIRDSVKGAIFELPSGPARITFSFGIATTNDVGFDRRQLVEEAQHANRAAENDQITTYSAPTYHRAASQNLDGRAVG